MLSIIMSTYNETYYELNESISSILNQTYRNFEFIIVDDAPFNEIMHNELLDFSKKDNRIKLIFNTMNLGLDNSINKGIKQSKGSIIARMDADDISKKKRLYEQLQFMKSNNLDFVCSNFSTITPDKQLINNQVYSKIGSVNQKKLRRAMSRFSIADGPTFMFRKYVFNAVGGYRQSCIDDYDFAAMAMVNGFKLGYQATPFIYKRIRTNSISNTNNLDQYMGIRIITLYLRKYKFNRIVPSRKLFNFINNISASTSTKFKKFRQCRINTKSSNHYFNNLIESILIALSCKIIFSRCIWYTFINHNQERYLK